MIHGIAGAAGKNSQETGKNVLEKLTHRATFKSFKTLKNCTLGAVSDEEELEKPFIHQTCEGFGGYASAEIKEEGNFVLERDPVGLKPLFYAKKNGTFSFSSEKQALWKNGFRNVKTVEAGTSLEISLKNLEIKKKEKKSLEKREIKKEFSEKLLDKLEKSVKRLLCGAGEVGIAFSGGIDSSTLAVLVSRNKDPTLLNVGLKGSKDIKWGKKASKLLGFDLIQKKLEKKRYTKL